MPRHPSLRTMLFIAASLAVAKVWASDRYHRAIYSDALIAAYGDKARVTCQKEFGRITRAYGNLKLSATNVVIGSPAVKVAMWDMDNPLWEVRYKHPHLMLTAEPLADLRCAFDVTAGLASVEGDEQAP